jgi:hypothetical protein
MQINILIICNIINNNIIKVFKVKIKGKEDYKLGFKNGSAGMHSHLNYQSYLSIVFFLLIQVKNIMFLLNSHQAITSHKNIVFSRFTLNDNILPVKNLFTVSNIYRYFFKKNIMHYSRKQTLKLVSN